MVPQLARAVEDYVLRVVWGDTPESWLCVGCGADTAPGSLGRNEMIAAYKANGYTVPDIDISSQSPDQEVYTVRAAIWQEVEAVRLPLYRLPREAARSAPQAEGFRARRDIQRCPVAGEPSLEKPAKGSLVIS